MSRYGLYGLYVWAVNEQNFERVNTIAINSPLKDFPDVFDDKIGTLPGTAHFEVDPSVTPVISPTRAVNCNLKPKIKKELADLVEQRVIAPTERATEWLSALVCTPKKNGDVRICLDPRPLNKALKREHHHLATLKEMLPELAKAKIFSTFDLCHGYWHISLDEDSSYLTTFDTPFGRYRWLRLPFGTKISSEMFQRRLYQAIGDIKGLLNIADDILIYGEGDTPEAASQDHDHNLVRFLERCRSVGIKLNPDKCKLQRTQVPFMGHLVTDEGIKPDPEKVKAIIEMPPPTDVEGVFRLCGTINFLKDYIPSLASAMEPIHALKRKDVPFVWTGTKQKAFDRVKELISNLPNLRYYDSEKQLTVQCDASLYELGEVLLQKDVPIAYASRSLRDAETRYSPIEKELLAIVWSLEKFHQYTYARHVHVQSDHKPLEAILRKPLHEVSTCLQRMVMRLQTYDINVTWLAGKKQVLTDTLSRAYIPTDESDNLQDDLSTIHYTQSISVPPERIAEIQKQSAEDYTLQALCQVISSGWPETASDLPPPVACYFHCHNELSCHDGVILKNDCIIIPSALRKTILEKIHSSHLGITGCRRRAWENVYWPNMTNDIKEYVSLCSTCKSYETANAKEPLIPHDIPDRPWAKLGINLFSLNNQDYLITVDYFSGFFEVEKLKDTTSMTIITKLKAHFARYGSPEVVVSDNGPQFSCLNFNIFAKKWDFEHRPSSPGNSKANGKAEAAVKVAKNLMKKAIDAKSDVYLALLDLRNTPTQGQETSPAQRSRGR